MYKKYIGIVITGIILLIFAHQFYPQIFFDSSVYIGIAKQHLGQGGLNEHIRPPLYPLWLAPYLQISDIIPLQISIMIIQLGIYTISLLIWFQILTNLTKNEPLKFAAFAAIAFSTQVILAHATIMAESLGFVLTLLALWLTQKKQPYAAGLALGCAMLAKFFFGIILIQLLLMLPTVKNRIKATIAAILPLALYLITQSPTNPLKILQDAQYIASHAVGCTQLFHTPFLQYLAQNLFDSVFLPIFVIMLFMNRERMLYAILALIPFILVMKHPCTDPRYGLFILLPIILEVVTAWNKRKLHKAATKVVTILIIIQLLLVGNAAFSQYNNAKNLDLFQSAYNEIANYTKDRPIASTTPFITIPSNGTITILYYPLYNSTLIQTLPDKLEDLVLIDTCTGDMMCPTDDSLCETKTREFLQEIQSQYDLKINKSTSYCRIELYEK
ncbi:MAG TPA: hypothetical protein VK158_05895 [Acidobacteriota bacterium]|nr:hypothetical protein [Acidobacteriota bacterium]